MAKQTISFNVTMTIDLAEGETELPRKERDAIAERIFHDLKEHGVTSDDYEGGLDGEFVAGVGYNPELTVTDLVEPKVLVRIGNDGFVTDVQSNMDTVEVKLFDADCFEQEGHSIEEIDAMWEEGKSIYPNELEFETLEAEK